MLPVWLTDTVTPDLDRALHYTHLWGLEGLALRTLGRAGDRVPFVNEAKLRRRIAEHEMPVAAVVPGMFEGDVSDRIAWMNELAAFEETLAFCRRIDSPLVLVSAFLPGAAVEAAAGVLRSAGETAARHGIVVGVCNEWAGAFPTARALAAVLDAVAHPAVRAAWSPAEALRAGEPARAGVEALRGRLAFVRCFDGAGEAWRPTPLGEGGVGWGEVLGRLRATGYEGPVSLEVTTEPRPRAGLRDATTLLRMLRAAERGAKGNG
ncbi:sugar phosphate isomerase/epimerase family protein [Rhodocaloribacter sp.]